MRVTPGRIAALGIVPSLLACTADERAADIGDSTVVSAAEGTVRSADGAEIFYRFVGSGPDTVIIIHGGPGFTMDYLVADFEPLAARHVLLFYDQRGTGRSTLVSDSAGLDAQRFVDDIEALRSQFELGAVNLLGHSWGAAVAALYALRSPELVDRMLIVGGVPLRGSELQRAFRELEAGRDSTELRRMRQAFAARQADPADAEACREYYVLWFRPFFVDSTALGRSRGDFCAGSAESRRNKMESVDRYVGASLGDYDWRDALRRAQVPTLIIHGDADPLFVETAVEWAETMPNSRLLVFEGVSHFIYLEAPERFFAAVDAFLAGGWPADARRMGGSP
jgi:proline iminopeptidase